MPDRIRGITIEIDGDTKGLSQALKGVNKDLKQTQTQLRDVEKLLKLDPHNVTLLKQKMELLGREISSTRDKLNQLKSVQDKMEEGLRNGSVSVEQYEAWQREIIATENELKNLEAELAKVPTAAEAAIGRASDSMIQLGDKISAVGDKVSAVGDKMTQTVTAGIVAAGAAAVESWKEVDSALDTVIARTGATGADLDEFQDIINSIATTVPTDFQTIAEAVGEVNTRFDSTGAELEGLSSAFIKFAQLNGTDVASSIDEVSSMMRAWGLESSDTLRVLNLLNGVGQQTGASVNSLASAMQTNVLSFKELNLDAAQAATLLGQMEKNGIDASAGMTALRHAMAQATDQGKTLEEVIREWQRMMQSAGISDADKMAATEDLFGSRAYGQLFNALQEGTISFTNINASMSDFTGNLERTFDATLDPIDEFTTTMNDLKILGAEIGEEVLPVLVDVLKDLKPILDDIKTAWESMSEDEQRQLIENLGKLAVIGPSLSITGRTITAVGSAISMLGKAGKALSSLGLGAKISSLFGGGATATAGTTLGASIGTSIAAGLAAALAGLEIGKLLDNYVIGPIMEFFGSDDAKWYKDFHFFGEGGLIEYMFDYDSIGDAVSTYYGAIKLALEDVLNGIKGFIDRYKSDIESVMNFLKGVWDTGVENIRTAFDTIKGIVEPIVEGIKEKVTTVWENVTEIFTNFKDKIFETFTAIWDKISEIWNSLGELFQRGFDIKLPHISVTGGVAPYGIGGSGSLPKFSVDWYANGGILTQPTIFGMQNGHLLGGGEAGAEAVLPLSQLGSMITEGMTAAMGGAGDTVINVSIDNNSLGSVILTAQQMMNLRRGR